MFSQPMSFLQTRSPESPGKPLQRHLQRIGRCSRTTPVVSEGNLAGRCDLDGMNSRSKVVEEDRKSTRLNSSHLGISYAVFCLKKVPLDIAIMADFVVAVDGGRVERLNNLKGLPKGDIAAAEIGSRAGRVLSILFFLRDRDAHRLNLLSMALPFLV